MRAHARPVDDTLMIQLLEDKDPRFKSERHLGFADFLGYGVLFIFMRCGRFLSLIVVHAYKLFKGVF